MSKKQLKIENQWANINIIDMLSYLDPTENNKYLPIILKIYKNYYTEEPGIVCEIKKVLKSKTTLNNDVVDRLTGYEAKLALDTIGVLPTDMLETLTSFHEHMVNNRIPNKDITTYTNLDQIKQAIAIGDVSVCTKEDKKSIDVIINNDTWLMLKPLTYAASCKYGSGTKWCTTAHDGPSYFYNYSESGSLIYTINKQTGRKIATHIKPMGSIGTFEPIFKNYDELDREVDTMFCDFTQEIYDVIKDECDNLITNRELIRINYPDIFKKEWTEERNNIKECCVEEATPPEQLMGIEEDRPQRMEDPPMVHLTATNPIGREDRITTETITVTAHDMELGYANTGYGAMTNNITITNNTNTAEWVDECGDVCGDVCVDDGIDECAEPF